MITDNNMYKDYITIIQLMSHTLKVSLKILYMFAVGELGLFVEGEPWRHFPCIL
jgi:hypothetical protein